MHFENIMLHLYFFLVSVLNRANIQGLWDIHELAQEQLTTKLFIPRTLLLFQSAVFDESHGGSALSHSRENKKKNSRELRVAWTAPFDQQYEA